MADHHCDGRVLVADRASEPVDAGPLGAATRYVTGADAPFMVIHVAIGPDAPRHYHRFTTEFCVCTAGAGAVVCDGERIDLRIGVAVTIKPGVVHQYFSDADLEIVLLQSPAPGSPIDREFTDSERLFA